MNWQNMTMVYLAFKAYHAVKWKTLKIYMQSGSENWPFEMMKHSNPQTYWRSDFIWSGFQRVGLYFGHNHLKTRPFKFQTFLSRFKMVLTKRRHLSGFQMVSFQISDFICNPDHLQNNLLSTFWYPDMSVF